MVVPSNTGTVSLSTMSIVPRVSDPPIRRWRATVLNTRNFMLEAPRIYGMLQYRALSSQMGSSMSPQTRFESTPVSEAVIIRRVHKEYNPTEAQIL